MTPNSNSHTIDTADLAEDAGYARRARQYDPAQWHQAIGIARQACARVFRDGGSPADALGLFGLGRGVRDGGALAPDWSKAVSEIAELLCSSPLRRAA